MKAKVSDIMKKADVIEYPIVFVHVGFFFDIKLACALGEAPTRERSFAFRGVSLLR